MERDKKYWYTQVAEKTLDAVRERTSPIVEEGERRQLAALRVVKSAGQIGGLTAEEIKHAIEEGRQAAMRRKVIGEVV